MRKTALALAACAAMALSGHAQAESLDLIEVAAMMQLANRTCETEFADSRIEAIAKIGGAAIGLTSEDEIIEAVAAKVTAMDWSLSVNGNRELFCSRAASMASSFGE